MADRVIMPARRVGKRLALGRAEAEAIRRDPSVVIIRGQPGGGVVVEKPVQARPEPLPALPAPRKRT